jgi:UDP-2,3-diacylglucosamine hydrolase
MSVLFISDLHLSSERPDIIELFVKFMNNDAQHADALYILGDLFEVWLGDDYYEPELEPAITALRQFASSGKLLYLLHGNRDFLMDTGFEKMTGCKILPDPSTITLHEKSALISHGDELCIDDTEYMEFRKMVRDPQWQKAFLAKPVEQRIAFAKQARSESISKTQQKELDIMDVNQNAVEKLMADHGVELLIHGHTHRPNTHRFNVAGKSMTRIVLGDWYEHGSVLTCDKKECELKSFTL